MDGSSACLRAGGAHGPTRPPEAAYVPRVHTRRGADLRFERIGSCPHDRGDGLIPAGTLRTSRQSGTGQVRTGARPTRARPTGAHARLWAARISPAP
jgi:hypothetical protein